MLSGNDVGDWTSAGLQSPHNFLSLMENCQKNGFPRNVVLTAKQMILSVSQVG